MRRGERTSLRWILGWVAAGVFLAIGISLLVHAGDTGPSETPATRWEYDTSPTYPTQHPTPVVGKTPGQTTQVPGG